MSMISKVIKARPKILKHFAFYFCFGYEEIANVANNLDSLNTALDTIEERADSIRAQLLELLASNREIRQSIREENEKLQLEGEPNEDSNAEPATEQDSNQKSDE